MEETINSFITLAGSLVGLTFVIYVLLNSDRFTSLEKDLQDIVDESKCETIHQKIIFSSKMNLCKYSILTQFIKETARFM